MKKIAQFKDRLYESIIEENLSQKEVAEKAGISTSLLNKYLKGISEAGNNKLFLIAKALNVNPVWLMGYDVDKYDVPEALHITEERRELIQKIEAICHNATDDELKLILRIIKSMIEK